MPGSFELREDMGEDRLRAVKEWLRAEGYEYRFRRKRWRTWTRPDRPGEGLRPDGIEEDENTNEYPSGASINVSMWDMIEKNFPEPGSERRLQGSSVSAASPICSDFQTFCPDWLHFGHFLCFGGIAASQLSHRIFPIYF